MKDKEFNILICDLKEEVSPLEEIKILPIGDVKSQKGNFTVDSESLKLMKEHFKRRGIDIVIDYEHQSLTDKMAIAGGWIKDFYIKDGAVVAKVEWTKKAKEQIESKEYRYLSPVIIVRKKDNKVIKLHSVALTNTPAIDSMYPLINRGGIEDIIEDLEEKESKENMLEKLTKILGMNGDINEDITEEEALKKITEIVKNKADENISINKEETKNILSEFRKEVASTLELKEDVTEKEIKSKLLELKENISIKEEFLRLKSQVEQKEIDGEIKIALEEGKILKNQIEEYKKLALKDKKIFENILKNAPRIVPLSETYYDKLENNRIKIDDEYTIKACKTFGISKEDIKKYGGKNNE